MILNESLELLLNKLNTAENSSKNYNVKSDVMQRHLTPTFHVRYIQTTCDIL